MRTVFSAAIVAGSLLVPGGANAVSVTLTDSRAGFIDTFVYNFGGLPTTAAGDGTLTIATTGSGTAGIDLGSDVEEFMDVSFDGTDLGRYECFSANDGGSLIQGATGTISDCLFSLDLTLSESLLTGAIGDGAVTVELAMGDLVAFSSSAPDVIAVTLAYEESSAVVPLPASLPFLLAGLGGLALIARRR